MKWFCIISVLLMSCISGSLQIENSDQYKNEVSSTNYIRRDIMQPISDSLMISFDHSVNDKPIVFDGNILISTGSGHSFIYSNDTIYHDIYESGSMRLNQGSTIGPVIYKNFILFALGSGKDNLQLYDLNTSTFVWKIRVPFGLESRPIINNDYIYLATMNGLVMKLFLGDASEQWRYNTGNHINADLNSDQNLIYAINLTSELFAISSETGSVKWKQKVASSSAYSQPLIMENKIIVSTIGGNLRSFNKEDGSELWSLELNEPIYGNMASDSRYIYFGTNGEFLYKINQLGEIIWKFETKGIVNAQPLVGENNIYFGSGSGFFYVISKANAELIWSKQFEGRIVSSPVFWQDRLLVFSDNDDIYELRSRSN